MLDFGKIMGGIPGNGSGQGLPFVGTSAGGLGYLISRSLTYLIIIAGSILLLYLIYGGFQMMTSGGNPDKMKSAQQILTNAVIGFLLIFVSYWLVQLVGQAFGIEEVNQTFK